MTFIQEQLAGRPVAECHFVSADAGMRDAAVHAGMLADRFGPVGNHEHKWRKEHLPIDILGVTPETPPIPYDRSNNIQIVSLPDAPAGDYKITVRADNTPTLVPQEFALGVLSNLWY